MNAASAIIIAGVTPLRGFPTYGALRTVITIPNAMDIAAAIENKNDVTPMREFLFSSIAFIA